MKHLNKKITIIIVFVLLSALAGYGWRQKRQDAQIPDLGTAQLPQELRQYEHLFVFENFDPNLPDQAREKYFERFTTATNVLRNDPVNFNAWLELGKVHKNMNAFEKARDAWVHLGEISPENSISFGNVGDLYAWFLFEPAKGETAYLTALENEPDEINFRRNLAEIYAKLLYADNVPLQKEKIIPLLEEGTKAASSDVEKAEMAALLGSYFRDWGDNANAIQWYQKTLTLDPAYPNRNIIQDEIARLQKMQ